MAKMVIPTEVDVSVRVTRGEGINVQTELPMEIHERLRLEAWRRKRQGLPCTLEAIVRELLVKASADWPRLPDDK